MSHFPAALARCFAAVVCAAAALLLGGCFSSLKHDPTHYYVLSEVSNIPVLNSDGTPRPDPPKRPKTPLHVNVVLPVYLDRTELVLRPSENRLDMRETELWLEPPAKACARVFARDLAARLGTEQTSTGLSGAPPRDGLLVSLDVSRFDGTPRRGVILRARWRVTLVQNGTTLSTGEREVIVSAANIQKPSAGSAAEPDSPGTGENAVHANYVRAMSEALGQFSHIVAEEVSRVTKE
ncbi:MAG: PqiC family protein [Puniceicoccales bacterium]|jgi:uncharacterized lipoprotein YmbA|nr:PqiC family protein [Puniceicoccales bacterium]